MGRASAPAQTRRVHENALLILALAACSDPTLPPAGEDGGSNRRDAGLVPGTDGGAGDDAGSLVTASPPCERPPAADCEAIAPGRCLYVSLTGDDAADGSIGAPFRHLWRGIAEAGPGDFVYVREGHWRMSEEAAALSCGDGRTRTSLVPIATPSLYGEGSSGETCTERWPAYEVRSGTADAPITIAAFRDEHVVLDGEGADEPQGGVIPVVAIGDFGHGRHVAYWTVRGFDIVGGGVSIPGNGLAAGGGSDALANTNHIVIEHNQIHDVMTEGGGNPGMVRIDRGDFGGPFEITVRCNDIYDMRDNGTADWSETTDAQHFGAVTTLSAQTYLGAEVGGTGRIVIERNRIRQIPHAFFFKNPAEGPIEIRDNRIWDCQGLGLESSSNLVFENNLVYPMWGFTVGTEVTDPEIEALSGQNAVIRNNTFLGHSIASMRSGRNHTIRSNVIAGCDSRVGEANWDTPSVLAKSEVHPDVADPAMSAFQDVALDDNCYAGPNADFQLASRYLPPAVTGADWVVEHYSVDEARPVFGWDATSVVVTIADPSELFRDPASGDYTLVEGSPCAGRGADLSRIPSP